MVKNQYKKVRKMYELLGEFLAKHHFINGPITATEIAIQEQEENDLIYRGYKMSHSKHHLKVTKNKA